MSLKAPGSFAESIDGRKQVEMKLARIVSGGDGWVDVIPVGSSTTLYALPMSGSAVVGQTINIQKVQGKWHALGSATGMVDAPSRASTTAPVEFGAHAETHETGGSDELNIELIPGILSDSQIPSSIARDSELHDPVTIGTGGSSALLSIDANQVLTLATASAIDADMVDGLHALPSDVHPDMSLVSAHVIASALSGIVGLEATGASGTTLNILTLDGKTGKAYSSNSAVPVWDGIMLRGTYDGAGGAEATQDIAAIAWGKKTGPWPVYNATEPRLGIWVADGLGGQVTQRMVFDGYYGGIGIGQDPPSQGDGLYITKNVTITGDLEVTGTIINDAFHDPVSIDSVTHADDVLGLTGQMITFKDQLAGCVFAGAATGTGPPEFRALVESDMPTLTGYLALAGVAGGQEAAGGNGSGDSLTLSSTSHATKGDVILQPDGGRSKVGGALWKRIVSKTANYVVSAVNDHSVMVDCSSDDVTISLPTAAGAYDADTETGQIIVIKKTDDSDNILTVLPNGADLIDGLDHRSTMTRYDRLEIQSDGTGWNIIAIKWTECDQPEPSGGGIMGMGMMMGGG